MGTKDRVIFHIDVNSAFLSWSAVKMLSSGGPDVREVPSVVSGDPSDRRSIVSAKSIPAKKYGINTGEPISMALRKCPDLVIVRGDFPWYRKCSHRFISICREYSPVLEQFSIDECFLDMTQFLGGRPPEMVARELGDMIRTRLGFTVNVGIGPNKLLAKMASDFEKPDKVHTLWKEEIPLKMWPLPVRDLLWVGRKTAAKLSAYGLDTIGKLASVDVNSLIGIFGANQGRFLHRLSVGEDDSPVQTQREEPKSYSAERTQRQDVSDPSSMDRILFSLAVTVAHRMRMDNFRASTVSIFVKDASFNVASRQCPLDQPTDVTAVILNAARGMLPSIWREGIPIRQVGLGVSSLTHENFYQPSLWDDSFDKMEQWMQWDRQYDAAHPQRDEKWEEDPVDTAAPALQVKTEPDIPTSEPPTLKDAPGPSKEPVREPVTKRVTGEDKHKVTEFFYPSGELALLGAKHSVREHKGHYFSRVPTREGEDCFEVTCGGWVVERHIVKPV